MLNRKCTTDDQRASQVKLLLFHSVRLSRPRGKYDAFSLLDTVALLLSARRRMAGGLQLLTPWALSVSTVIVKSHAFMAAIISISWWKMAKIHSPLLADNINFRFLYKKRIQEVCTRSAYNFVVWHFYARTATRSSFWSIRHLSTFLSQAYTLKGMSPNIGIKTNQYNSLLYLCKLNFAHLCA